MGGGYDIIESFECLLTKMVHGEVYLTIVIVPIKVDFNIFLHCFAHQDVVILFEGVDHVVGIIAGGVLDTKIVDDKHELDRACIVLPQPKNNFALSISSCIEMLFQVMPEAAGLRKAIHAANTMDVYPTIGCGSVLKIVFLYDFFRDVAKSDFGKPGGFSGVMRQKLMRSMIIKQAPGIDITPLRNILMNNKVAMFVPTSFG